MNAITAYIDGSLVYGVSKEAALNLRTGSYGQLWVRDSNESLQGTCPDTAACPFKLLPLIIENGEFKVFTGTYLYLNILENLL